MVKIQDDTSITVPGSVELSQAQLRLLATAYLPLIGTDAFSIYMFLASDSSLGPTGNTRFGKDLVSCLGRPYESIVQACRMLEGIGLLLTFSKCDDRGATQAILVPQVPLPPQDLFRGKIGGLLLQRVGQKRFESIQAQFPLARLSTEGYFDSTESGYSVFGDSQDTIEKGDIDAISRSKMEALRSSLNNCLKDLGFTIKVLHGPLEDQDFEEPVLQQIIFYGCTVKQAAQIIVDSTSDTTGIFSFARFKEILRDRLSFALPVEEDNSGQLKGEIALGGDALSQDLRAMDETPCGVYIAQLIRARKLPKWIADLVSHFQADYQLREGVINAIFSYCIKRNDNVIPSPNFFDVVASSLVKKHPDSAYTTLLTLKEQEDRIALKKKKNQERTEKAKRILQGGGNLPASNAVKKKDDGDRKDEKPKPDFSDVEW